MSETMPKPVAVGLAASFGFGDRLGLATPGHMEAMRREGGGILPIYAQQSIREMTRTNRTPTEVMKAAQSALSQENFRGVWGADADHLKTKADVDATAAAGFVFFTIDPSAHVDVKADDYGPAELEQKFKQVREVAPWADDYLGKTIKVPGGPTIRFDAPVVHRAAVKYGRAIRFSIDLARHIERVAAARHAAFEIELSVDETPQPTTPAEHYIIADQLRQADVKVVSLAPRYVGDFEKGIDYKGELAAFERSLAEHAAIARELGPYKLSLHSGSDKLSVYPSFARITQGMFHVKTAGTSYLEALRVAARHDVALLRRIIEFSRGRFEADKATYHISARLAKVPGAAEVADARRLEAIYLNENDGRQVLHVTFGSVLTDRELAPALKGLLEAHPDTHKQVLAEHLGKHLAALRRGM